MSEQYGKSQLEIPKFTIIEMQKTLNELRSAEIELASVKEKLGIATERSEIHWQHELNWIEERKAFLEKITGLERENEYLKAKHFGGEQNMEKKD